MIAAVRAALTSSVALLALTAVAVPADDFPSLVQATDLQADARVAKTEQIPLLLAVTRADCPYCEGLKRHVLVPMLRNAEYESKVMIRELCIDPDMRLRGFVGEQIMASALAERYKATLTPTVLLLDEKGEEVTERIVGFNSIDFYGYYLDTAIDLALERVKSSGRPQ